MIFTILCFVIGYFLGGILGIAGAILLLNRYMFSGRWWPL